MVDKKISDHSLEDLCRVGVALSCEKDINKLLEMIASVARRFTNAEGCTIYFCNEDKGCLDFAVVQNDQLDIYEIGCSKESDWPSVKLFDDDGSENHSNVSAHCALTGQTIMIKDVYDEDGFDFTSTREFDKIAGYRSRSMLLIPMLDNHDDVIGVLQLLNAKSDITGEMSSFRAETAEIVRGLASQASVAVVNVRLINRINKYTHLGVALSAEKDIFTVLEMIAEMARRYTYAEGCTVYVSNEKKDALDFAVVQNEVLGIDLNSENEMSAWPSIPLYQKDGSENHRNVSAHCALAGEPISIADVYNEEGFDFSGTREFDVQSNYRSVSMLLIPMTDHEDEVIGVLQLLNARKGITRKICPFSEEEIPMVRGLASQAAVAVSNVRLVEGMENLLKSFVQCIAVVIDEKSPYTAGHIQRVAKLTELLVEGINNAESEVFVDVNFTQNDKDEIDMAAWLHDIGKIATPEFIFNKATKLETIFDRIELVRLRVEILKREQEVASLKSRKPDADFSEIEQVAKRYTENELSAIFRFLHRINIGEECMRDEDLEELERVAALKYSLEGETFNLLNEDESDCCAIRRGTLTDGEREVINHHVAVSMRMLESLPFIIKWERVPQYAGMHHEKLDGSGYPRGLTEKDTPLPARILAVADVFEALTAADRPYKRGKTLSEALKIMKFMVSDNHLDGDVCDILAQEGVAQEYANLYMGEKKRGYWWKGKQYGV